MAHLNVLVVEDDAMIGMLLAEMLEAMGYDVCAVAATEDDAVANATRYRPGLMIVDMRLREGSGAAAVSRILCSRAVPHVFMTGDPVRSLGVGATVLQKPFLEHDLVRAIRHVIGELPVSSSQTLAPEIAGKH
jgi:DNA-binding response OmpR family regulator